MVRFLQWITPLASSAHQHQMYAQGIQNYINLALILHFQKDPLKENTIKVSDWTTPHLSYHLGFLRNSHLKLEGGVSEEVKMITQVWCGPT